MTPQTIETIRNTLEDAVETRGYELSSALHDVRDQTSRLARQTQVKGPVSGGLVTRMWATLEKNATRHSEALMQFKLAETALEEFNATYPKGSET